MTSSFPPSPTETSPSSRNTPKLESGLFDDPSLRQRRNNAGGRGHIDGWGVSYWNGDSRSGKWVRSTSASALHCDGDGRPPKLGSGTSSMVFAHIRASSMGKAAPPSGENSHPFVFSNGEHHLSFMHNGNIARFKSARKARWSESLPPSLRSQVIGGTDSELLGAVVFSTFLSSLDNDTHGNVAADEEYLATSLVHAVETVLGTIAEDDQAAGSFSSVNMAMSLSDSVLVVARFRSGKEDPPSLYAYAGSEVRILARSESRNSKLTNSSSVGRRTWSEQAGTA